MGPKRTIKSIVVIDDWSEYRDVIIRFEEDWPQITLRLPVDNETDLVKVEDFDNLMRAIEELVKNQP